MRSSDTSAKGWQARSGSHDRQGFSMNPQFRWKRVILGFLLAPLGVQIFFLFNALVGCLFGSRFCAEAIVFGGFAMAIFVFPTTWFFELCFGAPIIGILWYFRWLRSWVLVSIGGFTGALIFLPQAISRYQNPAHANVSFWPVVWGTCFGAATSTVMWVIAFREPKAK